MLIIRNFKDDDTASLLKITKNSFLLGSLSVDINLSSQIQGQYFYNTICKKSFYRNSTSCLIASLNSKPVGYIIYGINQNINEIIKQKTGAIILLTVDGKQQNQGIGAKLIESAINVFREKAVKLVTVGTDFNNVSALHLYHKFGFKKISSWDTYRLYNNHQINRLNREDIMIEPFGNEEGCLKLLTMSEQENSLLREPSISAQLKTKLQQVISQKTIKQIKENKSYAQIAKKQSQVLGIIVYNRDKMVEELIKNKTNSKVFQIKAIASTSNYNSKNIFLALLSSLSKNRDGIHYIEAYCGFDKYEYRQALEQCEFEKIHTTTTLHLSL